MERIIVLASALHPARRALEELGFIEYSYIACRDIKTEDGTDSFVVISGELPESARSRVDRIEGVLGGLGERELSQVLDHRRSGKEVRIRLPQKGIQHSDYHVGSAEPLDGDMLQLPFLMHEASERMRCGDTFTGEELDRLRRKGLMTKVGTMNHGFHEPVPLFVKTKDE